MGENIILAFIIWLCALTFIGIGVFAWKRKTPMHFWAGSTVKFEEINDIKGYNKANGIMWISYGSIYIIAGLFGLFNINLSGIIIGITSLPGLIVLILIYQRIYKKYKN